MKPENCIPTNKLGRSNLMDDTSLNLFLLADKNDIVYG